MTPNTSACSLRREQSLFPSLLLPLSLCPPLCSFLRIVLLSLLPSFSLPTLSLSARNTTPVCHALELSNAGGQERKRGGSGSNEREREWVECPCPRTLTRRTHTHTPGGSSSFRRLRSGVLAASAPATECLVLTERMLLQDMAPDVQPSGQPISLRTCYGMPGTDIPYAGTSRVRGHFKLVASYAMLRDARY